MISPKKKPLNQFLKFSNLALQMGLIIGLATFAGIKMDLYFKLENTFTIIFALLDPIIQGGAPELSPPAQASYFCGVVSVQSSIFYSNCVLVARFVQNIMEG